METEEKNMNIPTGKEAEQLAYASVASGEWNEDFTPSQFAEANPILDGKATIIDWAFFITGQVGTHPLDDTFANIRYLAEEWETLERDQYAEDCECGREILRLLREELNITNGTFDIFKVKEEAWRLAATVECVKCFKEYDHEYDGENIDGSPYYHCEEKVFGKNDGECVCAFDTIWAEASAIAEGEK